MSIHVFRKDVDGILRDKYVELTDLNSYIKRGWVTVLNGGSKEPEPEIIFPPEDEPEEVVAKNATAETEPPVIPLNDTIKRTVKKPAKKGKLSKKIIKKAVKKVTAERIL